MLKDPEGIEVKKTDRSRILATKLKKFRDILSSESIVDHWIQAHELGANVVSAVARARVESPGIGWIRGNNKINVDRNGGDYDEYHNLRYRSIEKWRHIWHSVSEKYL